jgi:hypothetical protein
MVDVLDNFFWCLVSKQLMPQGMSASIDVNDELLTLVFTNTTAPTNRTTVMSVPHCSALQER